MSEGLFPRDRVLVAPGAVHVPAWLPFPRQRELVDACREWGRGPFPYRRTVLPGGGVMSVRSLCLGRQWVPYRYLDAVGLALPEWLVSLGREAVAEAYGEHGGFTPDTALVNFYAPEARMGMHQDREERSGAPVVSLSLGDRCVFRFGNAEGRGGPTGTSSWPPGTCSSSAGPRGGRTTGAPGVPRDRRARPRVEGRLNITLRETGIP